MVTKDYVPDFVLTFRSTGDIPPRKLYIEAKGWLRPEDRTKLLAVRRQHPELDLRIVFEKDNKLSRTSKVRYSDWATKNNIQFAIGQIPVEWLSA